MIIIPARLASTRFPNKILADIFGLPMVVRSARNAAKVDEVCVACDDESVLEVCARHGVRAILTDKSHQSGTDRCNEAAQKLGLKADEIIINVQADEPFLEPEVLRALREKMVQGISEQNPPVWMASCMRTISKSEAQESNLVKVVVDSAMNALYFSRARIPYDRDGLLGRGESKLESSQESKPESIPKSPESALDSSLDSGGAFGAAFGRGFGEFGDMGYFGHLGVYAYSTRSLKEFCELPQDPAHSPLEHIEKLEQLRALYHGKRIAMVLVQTQSMGIDTPEDLQRALARFGDRAE